MKRWDVEVSHASGVTFVRSFTDREEANNYAESLDDMMFPWVFVRQVFNSHREGR